MRRLAHLRLGSGVALVLAVVAASCTSAPQGGAGSGQGVALHEHDCAATVAHALSERLAHPDPSLPFLPEDYSAPGSPRPMVACYSRESPPAPEVIARMEEEMYGLSLQYQLAARWT